MWSSRGREVVRWRREPRLVTLALDKVTADTAAAALQHCSTVGHAAASPPRSWWGSGEATAGCRQLIRWTSPHLWSPRSQIFPKHNIIMSCTVFNNTFLKSDLFCLIVEFLMLLQFLVSICPYVHKLAFSYAMSLFLKCWIVKAIKGKRFDVRMWSLLTAYIISEVSGYKMTFKPASADNCCC